MTTKDQQRTTLFLNPAIAKQAKAQAVLEEISLTALVEKALIKYLPKETIIKNVEK
jgi:predicted HicB family RNase H-like nuclease